MKIIRKENKILKRILPIICAVLCIATALTTPISAIVDSSQGDGTNYDLTARSPFPMTVGLAFDTSEKNVVFATDIGGFGQEFNTTLNGTDSFIWTSEASTAEELDGTLIYQFLDERKQDKEYRDRIEHLSSDGYGLASYRPIKVTAQSTTDLTQGLDCSSVVYRLQDVVINSSVIRKGDYITNLHQDASQEAINAGNIYSPNADDYRYLVPHVVIPTISETSGYLGTYNVVASITDEWGNEWDLNYSIPIDSRGATSDTFIPFLPMSIFDSYGKYYGEQAYNIGMSNTVVLNEYYGYLDVDYYQFQNVIPELYLVVNLKAEVGGEDTLIRRDFLPLGEYVGQTFNEWISSVDGQNGYTVTGGAGGITITYTDTENDFTYSGTITNSQGTNVYGSSIITTDEEYTANLQREVTSTTDELAGTWVFNSHISSGDLTNHNVNFTSNSQVFTSMYKGSNPDALDGLALVYANSSEIVYAYDFEYTGTWSNEAYRTINITSTLAEVTNGDALLTWLKANATKQGATSLITFTIGGTSYQAEEGMTWAQWVNSAYNTGGYSIGYSDGIYGFVVNSSAGTVVSDVHQDSVITNGTAYRTYAAGPISYMVTTDTPTTTATAEWVKVEGTEYGRSAMLTLPLWDTSNLIVDGRNYDLYSFPTIQKFIDGAKAQAIPVPEVDYTQWIGTAVGGFLNMELMPNFSIGGVLAILIGFSIVMLFLKYFAGG